MPREQAQRRSEITPLGVQPGMLAAVWKQHPHVRGAEQRLQSRAVAEESLRILLDRPSFSVATILSIAVSLFLLGMFIVLVEGVQRSLNNVGGDFQLTVFLRDSAAPEAVTALRGNLEQEEMVREVTLTTKEDALENFRREIGDHSEFLSGLQSDNPLPASIDLVFWPGAWDEEGVAELRQRLGESDLVDEVVLGNGWVERIQSALASARVIGMLVVAILVAMVVFLIGTTVSLTISSRSEEIRIMNLVGASRQYVRLPYVGSGMLQGLLGAVLSLPLVAVAVHFLNARLELLESASFGLQPFTFLRWQTTFVLLLLGALVGTLGSVWAVNRSLGGSR